MDANYILGIMLQLVPPGQSIYSQVPIPHCDVQCQQTPLCANAQSFRCSKPRFDRQLYARHMADLQQQGLSFSEAQDRARPLSYTRPETYEEGLVRYQIIAEAIVDVSGKMTHKICLDACQGEQKACEEPCSRAAPWPKTRKQLALLMVTVTRAESGWRSDVHSGFGQAARGDCDYVDAQGKPALPWTPGARMVAGSCKSVCIGQINTGAHGVHVKPDALAGIDYASTQRCLTMTAKTLARSYRYCTSPVMPWPKDWAGATLSAYGSGSSCSHKKLLARSHTFYKIMKHPRPLQPNPMQLLALPQLQQEIAKLRASSQQLLWVNPITLPVAAPKEQEPATVAQLD